MNSPRRPCGSGRGIAASPWCSSIGPWCRHPGRCGRRKLRSPRPPAAGLATLDSPVAGTGRATQIGDDAMKASLLAVLNESERLLVAETESAALAPLDEDAVAALHDRVRRARNKYVGQYRRAASARVPAAGGRGKARPANQQAAIKTEAFEEALARVSRRLAVLARHSAAKLRDQRLAAARGGRW